VTPLGTKHVVEAFYEEALACIEYLADPDQTGLDPVFTLAGFRRAAHIFGRSALLLSGGATLGFSHLGVVKALSEQGLLPDVLSGASMGALIACGTGVRTDAEIKTLFADPRAIPRGPFAPMPSSAFRPSARQASAPSMIRHVWKRWSRTTAATTRLRKLTPAPAVR